MGGGSVCRPHATTKVKSTAGFERFNVVGLETALCGSKELSEAWWCVNLTRGISCT